MRTLIAGAMAASLAGCSCYVAPQSGLEACTGADLLTCLDKNSDSRQRTTPEPSLSGASATTPKEKVPRGAATIKPSSALSGRKSLHAGKAPKATPDTAKIEPAAATPPPKALDPVIDKAKVAVAAELEDPESATFSEMNRSMRKNLQGEPIDTICGHVKSKKASGEDIGDRPFLYLVKERQAYVVDGSPTSVASTVYDNICK